jgi:DNA-directed RNA polymerase specialized sigma subunit
LAAEHFDSDQERQFEELAELADELGVNWEDLIQLLESGMVTAEDVLESLRYQRGDGRPRLIS